MPVACVRRVPTLLGIPYRRRECYKPARSQTTAFQLEHVMGKGNHSQKNDKKSKKPKQDKSKGTKPAAKR